MTLSFKSFAIILATAVAVSAITIPADLPNGSYAVVTSADGSDEFLPLSNASETETSIKSRGNDDIVELRPSRSLVRRAGGCGAFPDSQPHCAGGVVNPNHWESAWTGLYQDCAGSPQTKTQKKAFIHRQGEAVWFMCNYTGGQTQCTAQEVWDAGTCVFGCTPSSSVNAYAAGWVYSGKWKKSYGVSRADMDFC